MLPVKELLKKEDIDVNAKNTNDLTALMFAADQGFVEIAEDLIRGGADSSMVDFMGDNAFSHATQQGHTAIMEIL